jgi:uncharacterized protein
MSNAIADKTAYGHERLKEQILTGRPCDDIYIIDGHTHMGDYYNFHIPWSNESGMIEAMDAYGIAVAVVSHHASIAADYRFGNDTIIAAMRQYPGRFIGYAGINPNYPHDVLPELERCIAAGMCAVKLHPELHGDYPLDGANYRPMWEYAAAHSMVVLTHTYFNGDRLDVIERLAQQYPTATILLGHCALDLGLDRACDLACRQPNIIMDLCGPQIFGGVVEYLVGRVPIERITWGSDAPFLDIGPLLGSILYARISREEKAKILGLNMARLLDIQPRPPQS